MISGALVFIRSLAAQLVVQLLASLLVLTTPVGTGRDVHQSELLHPIFSHVHLIDGRIIWDDQRAAASANYAPRQPTSGPALGAGTGADAPGLAGLGLAVGPLLPDLMQSFGADSPQRLSLAEGLLPTEFRDSPQDPPPNLLA